MDDVKTSTSISHGLYIAFGVIVIIAVLLVGWLLLKFDVIDKTLLPFDLSGQEEQITSRINSNYLPNKTYNDNRTALYNGQYDQLITQLDSRASTQAGLTGSQQAELVLHSYLAYVRGLNSQEGVEKAILSLQEVAMNPSLTLKQRARALYYLADLHRQSGFNNQTVDTITQDLRFADFEGQSTIQTIENLYRESFSLHPTYHAAFGVAQARAQQVLNKEIEATDDTYVDIAAYVVSGEKLIEQMNEEDKFHKQSEYYWHALMDRAFVLDTFAVKDKSQVLSDNRELPYYGGWYFMRARMEDPKVGMRVKATVLPFSRYYAAYFDQLRNNVESRNINITRLIEFENDTNDGYADIIDGFSNYIQNNQGTDTFEGQIIDTLRRASSDFNRYVETVTNEN